MKLVDILAMELKEWPEGVEQLTQSQVDNELYQSFPEDHPMGAHSLAPKVELKTHHAERDPYPVVTREEWRDAVDALYPPLAIQAEWHGEGQPPIGIYVQIHNKTCRGVVEGAESFIGTNCKVLSTFVNVNGYEMVAVEDAAGACMCFRADMCGPVRTPEQIAAEEREKAILQMAYDCGDWWRSETNTTCLPPIFAAAYDAGYRKFEIVEGEE